MATKVWIGSLSGNAGTAGNWSPSGVPTAGDDLIFDDRAQSAITAGLTTFRAVILGNVYFRPGRQYPVGTASNYFEINVASGSFIIYEAGGSLTDYVANHGATAPELVVSDGPQGSGIFYFCGKANLSGYGIQSGNVTILRDPNFGTTSLATTISASAQIGPRATVVVQDNVTLNGLTALQGSLDTSVNLGGITAMQSGVLTTRGTATSGTINAYGGTWNNYSTGTIQSLVARGSFTHNRLSDDGYTITALAMEGTAQVYLGTDFTLSSDVIMLTAGRGPYVPTGTTIGYTLP